MTAGEARRHAAPFAAARRNHAGSPMLIISAAQMASLGRQRELDFRRRAVAYLSASYPDLAALVGDRWNAFIDGASEIAQRGGLRSELAVMTVCELVAVYGNRFHHENPWASYILFRCEIDPATRVARLRKYLPLPDRLQPDRNDA
jgi:hypothetical protein